MLNHKILNNSLEDVKPASSIGPQMPGKSPSIEYIFENLKDYIDAHAPREIRGAYYTGLLKSTEGSLSVGTILKSINILLKDLILKDPENIEERVILSALVKSMNEQISILDKMHLEYDKKAVIISILAYLITTLLNSGGKRI